MADRDDAMDVGAIEDDALNDDDAATPTDALSERVTTVVAEASAHGLQIDRRISAAPVDEEASAVPVDHLVLLTLRAWCNHLSLIHI